MELLPLSHSDKQSRYLSRYDFQLLRVHMHRVVSCDIMYWYEKSSDKLSAVVPQILNASPINTG